MGGADVTRDTLTSMRIDAQHGTRRVAACIRRRA
jgi:hypothetical protein